MDSQSYTSIQRVFIALATAVAFIGLGVQLLSSHPLWAVALMLAGVLYLLFEANFNPWSRQNIPGMLRFVVTIMIACTLIGIYLRPILEHFKVATNTAAEKHPDQGKKDQGKQDQNKPQEKKREPRQGHDAPITRIGENCPEQYKSFSNVQIAEWTMQEADKISEMSDRYTERYKNATPEDRRFFFTVDFKDCCLQYMLDLRSETICRLPPALKTSSAEKSTFREMTDGPPISPGVPSTTATTAGRYALYLRKLGVQLLRLTIPRHAPIVAAFSETVQPQQGSTFMTDVRIWVESGTISAGYGVLNLTGIKGRDISGINSNFAGLIALPDETIANDDLVKYLQTHPSATAFRIDREHPLNRKTPRLLTISGSATVHVLSAKVFDE